MERNDIATIAYSIFTLRQKYGIMNASEVDDWNMALGFQWVHGADDELFWAELAEICLELYCQARWK